MTRAGPRVEGSAAYLSALAGFGIAAHVAWITAWVVESARAAGYDWVNEQVSALAADGASTAPLMVPVFVVLGLGTIAQGVAVRTVPAFRVSADLVIAAGASAVAAGVFRCDAGCPSLPDGSWHNVVHQLAAIGYSAALVTAMFLNAWNYWRDARAFAAFSLACGTLAGPTFLFFEAVGHDRAVGVVERVCVATLSVWSIVVAARFLLTRHVRVAALPTCPRPPPS